MVVVLADDGDDRDLSVDGEVESSLLERKEERSRTAGSGSFGEDEEGDLQGTQYERENQFPKATGRKR